MKDNKLIDHTLLKPDASIEAIEKLCEDNEIVVYPQFKDAMVTPFAIAKYISLKTEVENLAKEIDFDLNTFINKEKVDWLVHKDFTNEITFTKRMDEQGSERESPW